MSYSYGRGNVLHQWPPVCSWYTSITSSFSISRALGVSSSLMRRPSKRKRSDATGTPTRSLYDFFNLPICVVIFTRKWISLESCPTTLSLMYSFPSPSGLASALSDIIDEFVGGTRGLPEKRNIRFSICVVAAGAWSGEVGRLVGIGKGTGIMGVPIPVEPRKRYVYCVHAPDGPGLDSPLLIDPNGTYFRREGLGGLYLCGQSPTDECEPSIENLDVDYDFFESNVWPTIANRVPSFENLKLQSSWAGYYDYNTFDQNGIIGLHPIFTNMFIATGFSGHGIQQAAGVGRAVMESILHGEYQTINLERFGFERVLTNEPLYEQNIV